MSVDAGIRELISVITKNRATLGTVYDTLESALKHEIETLGRTSTAALIPAGLLENYYTCLETIMLRISQYFENSLAPERWHSDLLRKMTVHIEGIRPRVFDDETYGRLVELQKFRHLEYDWDRIDFLVTLVRKAHPAVISGTDAFVGFLRGIRDLEDPGRGP